MTLKTEKSSPLYKYTKKKTLLQTRPLGSNTPGALCFYRRLKPVLYENFEFLCSRAHLIFEACTRPTPLISLRRSRARILSARAGCHAEALRAARPIYSALLCESLRTRLIWLLIMIDFSRVLRAARLVGWWWWNFVMTARVDGEIAAGRVVMHENRNPEAAERLRFRHVGAI